mmetsp:Transcript_6632/g.23423  ORF Transcript_6632/g.23423 Transcript_6632/m.23423 type:complete len:143 (-) Transcript_6632:82-510(-)
MAVGTQFKDKPFLFLVPFAAFCSSTELGLCLGETGELPGSTEDVCDRVGEIETDFNHEEATSTPQVLLSSSKKNSSATHSLCDEHGLSRLVSQDCFILVHLPSANLGLLAFSPSGVFKLVFGYLFLLLLLLLLLLSLISMLA